LFSNGKLTILYEYRPNGARSTAEPMNVKFPNLESISLDELWALHEDVSALLVKKITAEKLELELRLSQLRGKSDTKENVSRRPYPKVLPKYQNPAEPSETWSGRGKQPKWISAQLKSGKKLDDLTITRAHRAANKDRSG
jgi:DNA-binding protein H-NS